MRSATVQVTRRCDHTCGFCTSPDDESVAPSLEMIERSLHSAHRAGATTVLLAGGDPLLRPDLATIVARCRAVGLSRVVVSTPGVRLATRAEELREAGVTEVLIPVATTTPATHRALISERTHPRHVFSGIAAALAAKLDVAIELPIARGLPAAAARIVGLHRAFPALRRFVLAPAAAEGTRIAEQALPAEELAAELDAAVVAGEQEDVIVELSERHPVLPCAVALSTRARRLLSSVLRESPGEPTRAAAICSDCALASRCTIGAGAFARGGGAIARPITDAAPFLRPGKNPGTRLRVLDERDVEKFFHVDYEYGADVATPTSRIGIIYRCNQVCSFCELADMDTELSVAKVRGALDAAYARGSRRVIITGGEPTLSPDLVDHVRYARELGFEEIELQTNAVLLDRGDRARALRDAGLTSAQISLHGPDAAISDALTCAPGTHARTLRGVEALLAVGVRCLLNHLIFRDNSHLLVDFVELVNERFGAYREQIVIQFHSVRNEFASPEEARRHVARYTDYAGTLRRAIDRARALGFRTHDLQDPTGIPSLCVFGGDESYLGPILAQAQRPRFHAWESDWLTRVDACSSCDLSSACMGVPRYYVALHGDAEFVPIRRSAT